jgi:transposase
MYTTEFRQRLVAQCQLGVSVSRIALAHGINTNLLRKWIDRYRNQPPAPVSEEPSNRLPFKSNCQ